MVRSIIVLFDDMVAVALAVMTIVVAVALLERHRPLVEARDIAGRVGRDALRLDARLRAPEVVERGRIVEGEVASAPVVRRG